MHSLVITILVDNPGSWIMPYVNELINVLKAQNHIVRFVQHYKEIKSGDIAFFLGCLHIVPKDILSLNTHNLVVHGSALPKGKGWSPLTWQILEGNNEIPMTLFEATEKVDSGCIYFQEMMVFEGHELLEELHDVQGKKTIELCVKFIKGFSFIFLDIVKIPVYFISIEISEHSLKRFSSYKGWTSWQRKKTRLRH